MDTNRNRSIHPYTKALGAVAAVAVALAVAGPAFAQPNQPPAKKGCTIKFEGPGAGQSIEYPDGYSFSVNATDGKKHTYSCNDGRWTETVSLTAGQTTLRNVTILRTAGAFQAVRLR
jgi:hypothetical protein